MFSLREDDHLRAANQAPLPSGGGVPLPLPRSGARSGGRQTRTTSGSSTGGLRVTVVANPAGNQPSGDHRSSCTSDPVEQPTERAGPSTRSVPAVSSGPPPDRMSISASEGELSDEDSAALPPSGTVAKPESDPEMAAMLSRAAEMVGLEWNPPPRPEPSRLDDWYLGVARAGSQRPAPVPFFPEVHDELTKSWTAPFTARNRPVGSSSLTTLDGGAAKGYSVISPSGAGGSDAIVS